MGSTPNPPPVPPPTPFPSFTFQPSRRGASQVFLSLYSDLACNTVVASNDYFASAMCSEYNLCTPNIQCTDQFLSVFCTTSSSGSVNVAGVVCNNDTTTSTTLFTGASGSCLSFTQNSQTYYYRATCKHILLFG